MSPSDRPTARVGSNAPTSATVQRLLAINGSDSLSAPTKPVRRVGRRDLERIRAQLSDRDHAVLSSIRAFRIIQIHQLQRLHFDEHATKAAGKRVCRSVLERLHNHGLVHRLERRIGGFRAGSAGHIYALSPTGHRLLHDAKRGRRAEPTLGFVEHTLAIAEIATTVHQKCRQSGLELLELQPEPWCWRYADDTTRKSAATATLKPDLFAVVANADYELTWFIEIDRSTESTKTIAKKCAVYTSHWRSGTEQRRSGVFPKVLWVVPDDRRAEAVRRALTSGDIEADLFAVTTFDEALSVLVNFKEGAP